MLLCGCFAQHLCDDAATGACQGGQPHIVAWLQQAHGYVPSSTAVMAAAKAGHVNLLEQLLPEAMARCSEELRLGVQQQLLCAIAHGCPAEVLAEHYNQLMQGCKEQQQQVAAAAAPPQAAAAVVPQGAVAAPPLPPQAAAAAQAGMFGQQQGAAGDDSGLRQLLGTLLAAAAGSPTLCWAAKLDFLRSSWGAATLLRLLREERNRRSIVQAASTQHDYTDRLQHLVAAGMPLGQEAAGAAVARGRADAFVWLWDEGGLEQRLDDELLQGMLLKTWEGRLAVLKLLRQRGFVFSVGDVDREMSRSSSLPEWWEDSRRWLMDVVVNQGGAQLDRTSAAAGASAAAAAAQAAESWSSAFSALRPWSGR
ncbi:hypothetical protein HXX76_001741 [Chlamydomonas incerta]|uniref:Uncharacterized protein n=1 Tax=Chlamydomonas incerta TaxID=51695 RepID=A0A835WA03_CHLIN|nr:hypothetical protein HXX76_001741 [Chlamydomonas incerta]|eukprot:KAG2443381.1 hypothetical protein HXX76_001741 [Chlamydomonas incerta]